MTQEREPYILWLDASSRETEQVGGKAKMIAKLRADGFPVPRAFAVSTRALRDTLNLNGLLPALEAAYLLPPGRARSSAIDRLEERLSQVQLPEALVAEVAVALNQLQVPVAVRSSGVVEDTIQSSFAGAFETVLNRSGLEEVVSALRMCWSSVASDRVDAYRQALPPDVAGSSMGVVVQEMVIADKAGVTFTRDPFGDADFILIEAKAGGCEGLVAGQPADLTLWVNRGTRQTVRSCTAPGELKPFGTGEGKPVMRAPRLLRAHEVDQVVAMSLAIEETYGGPQDIEWAFAKGRISVLQARPLTAMRGASS